MPVLESPRAAPRARKSIARFLFPYSRSALLARSVGVALVVRLVVVLIVLPGMADPIRHFEQFGWEMGWVARSIATGHGFSSPFFTPTGPTALVPPGFAYLLAGVFRLFGLYSMRAAVVILGLNSVLSALTCIPVYFFARATAGVRVAGIAAWTWSIYPFSIYFATQVWEYALTGLLFTVCLCLVLRLATERRPLAWLGFGGLAGVIALINPAILGPLLLIALVAVARHARAGFRWKAKALLGMATLVAVLTPWVVRDYRDVHVIAPIRDNYWLEVWAGNSGDSFESNPAWTHPASNRAEMQTFQTLGEAGYMASKRSLAIDFITRRPAWFAVATLRRIVRYWTGFWSFGPRYLRKEFLDVPNFFFCSAITFFAVRGLRRLWRQDRDAALPLLILMAVFPLTYYVSHTSMDYRQPIEPEIVVLAVIGVFGLRDARDVAELGTGRT